MRVNSSTDAKLDIMVDDTPYYFVNITKFGKSVGKDWNKDFLKGLDRDLIETPEHFVDPRKSFRDTAKYLKLFEDKSRLVDGKRHFLKTDKYNSFFYQRGDQLWVRYELAADYIRQYHPDRNLYCEARLVATIIEFL